MKKNLFCMLMLLTAAMMFTGCENKKLDLERRASLCGHDIQLSEMRMCFYSTENVYFFQCGASALDDSVMMNTFFGQFDPELEGKEIDLTKPSDLPFSFGINGVYYVDGTDYNGSSISCYSMANSASMGGTDFSSTFESGTMTIIHQDGYYVIDLEGRLDKGGEFKFHNFVEEGLVDHYDVK